jgi:hypothetical protein
MLGGMRIGSVWSVLGLAAAVVLWPLTAADAEQVRSESSPASEHGVAVREPVPEDDVDASDAPPEADVAVAPDAHRVGEPQTPAAARVLKVLDRIGRRLDETRYQHQTVVAEWRGLYAWDCSGMVTWVLERAARGARNRILSDRPVARDFVEIIENSPTRTSYKGWSKLRSIDDVHPGDVFAWKRPRTWPRDDETGHVGFVLERPRPAPGHHRAHLVRIADATSVPHQDDTRDADGRGGFGQGTLLVTVDAEGSPVAYGWYGTDSRGVVPTHITFGRVHH